MTFGKKGKSRHSSIIETIDAHFSNLGITVIREFAVFENEKYTGAMDLYLTNGICRVALEAEFSADRIMGDLKKAQLAAVNQLIIVVPNYKVKRAVERKLQRCEFPQDYPPTLIQYLTEAIEQLTVNFSAVKEKRRIEKVSTHKNSH